MRIAYVCADPGIPVFGRKGASVHVCEVIRALIGHGTQVDLFATRLDGEPQNLEGIRIHHLPPSTHSDLGDQERALLAANTALASALEIEGPFDLVYERYSLWSYAAMEYAAERGIPGILEVNAPLIEEQAAYRGLADVAVARRQAERAFGAASTLLAVSNATAEYLETEFLLAGRVHVLPNGVDPQRIRPDVTPSQPGPSGSFTVGFVGTLKAWHGLETLVQAFAALHTRRDSARLLVVGEGPEGERMAAHVRSLGLADAVRFTGGVAPEDVPALLTSMDAGVAPYPGLERFYFSPLKLYEYMAAGLPVVATGIGQVAEVIDDGVSGLLCPPGDAVAFAEALARLAEDPQLRHRLGSKAREAVLRTHTWSSITARILELARLSPKLTAVGKGA